MVPVIQLANALIALINGNLSPSPNLIRRYMPYYDAAQVKDGKWFVVVSADEAKQINKVDSSKLSIDIGYQRGLPPTSKDYADPTENLPFLDACMEVVETMLVPFAEGGFVRDSSIANRWVLRDATRPLLYVPSMLLEYQIFTSVIKLEFFDEGI